MSKELSYLEAIREALFEEMRRDPKVFVLGEDVGPYGGAFESFLCASAFILGTKNGIIHFGEIEIVR